MAGQHLEVQGPHLGQFLLADALRGQLAGHALQPGQHFEGLQHIGLIQPHGHGATVGDQIHQPFGGQQLDGFAQRRARDAQLLAQGALMELGPGRYAPFHQPGAQPRGHLLMQGQP
jgi:hypothetical protein